MTAWLIAVAVLASQERLPVPEPAAQKESEALIRGIFREEYSKHSPADKLALARVLLEQGFETKDDPTARFVLFRESRDFASEAGDIDLAFEAVAALAKEFQVSATAMKSAALSTASKAAKTVDDHRKLAEAFLVIAEEALAEDEPDTASQAASSAASAARRAKVLVLVTKANAISREARDLKAAAQAVVAAQAKLASAPADPAAHATVGRHLCLLKGEWEAGLPHLAKGGEGALKDAAVRDLANPSGASDQAALGDGWWDLSEKETGAARDSMRRRASFWYEKAAPGLSGLSLVRVNQRIMAVAPEWLSKSLFGHWKMDDRLGTVAADSSPHKRHGRLEDATWAKGRLGGALQFDGHRSRVHIDAGELVPPWSVALWVLRENAPTHTARLMDAAGSQGASLRLEQSGSDRRVGITKYAVVDHAFKYAAPAGRWTHLAWVGSDKQVALFADGVQVDVFNQSASLFVDKLGSHGDNTLKGCLDDVRVYSRALSAQEIEMLYQFAPK